jgi:hypothetical protein
MLSPGPRLLGDELVELLQEGEAREIRGGGDQRQQRTDQDVDFYPGEGREPNARAYITRVPFELNWSIVGAPWRGMTWRRDPHTHTRRQRCRRRWFQDTTAAQVSELSTHGAL